MGRAEVFVAGRFWLLETLLLSTLLSVVFFAGLDNHLYDGRTRYSRAYLDKIDHPLADVGKNYPGFIHESKLNYRLTVPVLLHTLGVTSDCYWSLPYLMAASSLGIVLLSAHFARRITGDRVCGLFFALTIGATYIGSLNTTRFYDAFALLLVCGAMLPRCPWPIRTLLVFAACFTDERGLVASSLLLAQSACLPRREEERPPFTADFLSVLGGILLFLITRVLLQHYLRLSFGLEGVGSGRLIEVSRYWHQASWCALSGNWLLVALAIYLLFQQGKTLAGGFFLAILAAVVGSGFLVLDFVRSVSYALPAAWIGLGVLARHYPTTRLRASCFGAFLLTIAASDFTALPGPSGTRPLIIDGCGWLIQHCPGLI
jgi:hypothetical protein